MYSVLFSLVFKWNQKLILTKLKVYPVVYGNVDTRLMTMSPLYPCSKPCSTGTHIETVTGSLFCNHQWNYDGITASNLNPVGGFSILQSNPTFYHICSVTIVFTNLAI